MRKGRKLKTNIFYHYANELRKRLVDEEEIERIDFTKDFWKGMWGLIEAKELINININAPPASGKSITGFSIANTTKKKYFGGKLGIADIDRDQQEFGTTVKNPEIHDTIRVVDELNELEETGENSSVEIVLNNYFSDVMAQRNIHKISCSPTQTTDRNALIFLDVVSTDKINHKNYCKIYYRTNNAGIEDKQLLGIITVDVNEVLNEAWYKEYRKRKFEKMDLILKEGIFRPRVLQYARLIIETTAELEKVAKMGAGLTQQLPNIVRNYIKIKARKHKIPQSIIGEELATREVMGILALYKAHSTINQQINHLNKEEGLNEAEKFNKKKYLEETKTELARAIEIQIKELNKYEEINRKYNLKTEEDKETITITKK
jgi:hypothetical protein